MVAVFDLSPVQVGNLVNKVVVKEISLRVAYLSFPLAVTFHQCPYISFKYYRTYIILAFEGVVK